MTKKVQLTISLNVCDDATLSDIAELGEDVFTGVGGALADYMNEVEWVNTEVNIVE